MKKLIFRATTALFFAAALVGATLYLWSSYHRPPLPTPRITWTGDGAATLAYIDSPVPLPIIHASINGIQGPFLVDTGANMPCLNHKGIEHFKISFSPAQNATTSTVTAGGKTEVRMLNHIDAELAPGVSVHWPLVLVVAGDTPYLGIIDYTTMQRLNAVMNIKSKTITISK